MRIYVASLADYNAGRLHGVHIEITGQDAEDIYAEIEKMLAKSREMVAEEWAIHDYEGFGAYKPSEWESIEKIALLGKVVEELDDDDTRAFFAWFSNSDSSGVDWEDYSDDPDGLREKFREQYRGHWDTFKQFVLESEYGDLYLGIDAVREAVKEGEKYIYSPTPNPYSEIYDRLTNYIDWDQVARDLEAEGGFTVEKDTGYDNYGIFVFEMDA